MPALAVPPSLVKRTSEDAGPFLHDEGFQALQHSTTAHNDTPQHDSVAPDGSPHDDDGDDDHLSSDQESPAGASVSQASSSLTSPISPTSPTSPHGPAPQDVAAPNRYHPNPDELAADYNVDMSDSEGEGGAPLGALVTTAAAPDDGVSTPAHMFEYDLEVDDSDMLGSYGEAEIEDDDVSQPLYLSDYDEDDDDDVQLDYPYYPPNISAADAVLMDLEPPNDVWVDPSDSDEDEDSMDDGPMVDGPMFGGPVFDLIPINLSNPTPNILAPADTGNFDLLGFLEWWEYMGPRDSERPQGTYMVEQYHQNIREVRYADLEGDRCDLQGLDWAAMRTTRKEARMIRPSTYRNYVNRLGSDIWNPDEVVHLPRQEDFFRFKKMSIRRDVSLAHFQLRSVLACPTRTQAFYSSPDGIKCFNPRTGRSEVAINRRDFSNPYTPISTLDADCGVLMGGTLHGDYCIRAIDSEDKTFSEGRITSHRNGFTNHLKIHTPRRSCNPVAAIASNDCVFRVMDIERERLVSEITYRYPLNCSAISPDRQLRVAVGDDLKSLILNSETGEVLQELTGHRDYVFACDWSEDGWTVATSSQDMTIKIWDARRWCNSSGVSTPICSVMCEFAGARNLRFSPNGSGRRVLVAAESADYVNFIDAQTFASKQTIDIFGELGGVDFTNDGQDLTVLCNDGLRGGLLQLERCGRGPEALLEDAMYLRPTANGWRTERPTPTWDPLSTAGSRIQRRRPITLEAMEPF